MCSSQAIYQSKSTYVNFYKHKISEERGTCVCVCESACVRVCGMMIRKREREKEELYLRHDGSILFSSPSGDSNTDTLNEGQETTTDDG